MAKERRVMIGVRIPAALAKRLDTEDNKSKVVSNALFLYYSKATQCPECLGTGMQIKEHNHD